MKKNIFIIVSLFICFTNQTINGFPTQKFSGKFANFSLFLDPDSYENGCYVYQGYEKGKLTDFLMTYKPNSILTPYARAFDPINTEFMVSIISGKIYNSQGLSFKNQVKETIILEHNETNYSHIMNNLDSNFNGAGLPNELINKIENFK